MDCSVSVKTGTRDLHIMNDTEHFAISTEMGTGKVILFFRHKLNYIYVCTVKPYDV
jgi:hypothetical protein